MFGRTWIVRQVREHAARVTSQSRQRRQGENGVTPAATSLNWFRRLITGRNVEIPHGEHQENSSELRGLKKSPLPSRDAQCPVKINRKTYLVHRLVRGVLGSSPPSLGLAVNHQDRNPSNNHYMNLGQGLTTPYTVTVHLERIYKKKGKILDLIFCSGREQKKRSVCF